MNPKKYDSYWKFHTHRGTHLNHDIVCDPTSSDNEEKEGENRPVNLEN